MAVELDVLKADHARVKAQHATYLKRAQITTALMFISLVILVLALLFTDFSSPDSACSNAFCSVSPWITSALALLCVVIFAQAANNKDRGIKAYLRAMRALDSYRGIK